MCVFMFVCVYVCVSIHVCVYVCGEVTDEVTVKVFFPAQAYPGDVPGYEDPGRSSEGTGSVCAVQSRVSRVCVREIGREGGREGGRRVISYLCFISVEHAEAGMCGQRLLSL